MLAQALKTVAQSPSDNGGYYRYALAIGIVASDAAPTSPWLPIPSPAMGSTARNTAILGEE